MDACHLDVLQNSSDKHVCPVTKRINVNLDCTLQKFVEVNWVVRSDFRSLRHVSLQVFCVVDNRHASASQNVAWANEERKADVFCNLASLIEIFCHASWGVRDVELVEYFCEAVAIFCQVDRFRLSAHDFDSSLVQIVSKLQWSLPTKRNNYAIGIFSIHDVHHVFKRQRLEVKFVGCVIVSRYSFGVAVDHYRLKAFVVQCVRRMNTAIVKLNALPNPVWTCAQNHDFRLASSRSHFSCARVVGFVVVRRFALKLGSTSVNGLKRRLNAKNFTHGAHKPFISAHQMSDLSI